MKRQKKNVLWGEDTGACSVQSVISTDATKELCPAGNTFLKETTITWVFARKFEGFRSWVSGEEEQGEEEQVAVYGSQVCVGFSGWDTASMFH